MVNAKAGEMTEVTSDMAHAWVEVYVEGLGWVPVEVTGFAENEGGEGGSGGAGEGGEGGSGGAGGAGEGGEGGSGGAGEGAIDDLPFALEFTIKPIDVVKHWLEIQEFGGILTHDGTIEEVLDDGASSVLEELSAYGYTWETTVDGTLTAPGSCTTTITGFKLYAPGDVLVYEYDANNPVENENVNIIFETGVMTVTEGYLLDITLDTVAEVYDGTEYSYIQEGDDFDPYTWKILGGAKSDVILIFDKTKVPTLTNVGIVSEEEWMQCFTVLSAETNEDITSLCLFRFTGGFEIEKRLIVIEPTSWEITDDELTDKYDGEFIADEYAQPAGLVSGHKLEAVVFGSINAVGTTDILVETWRVVDGKGNDVTNNYTAEIRKGKLTVTK